MWENLQGSLPKVKALNLFKKKKKLTITAQCLSPIFLLWLFLYGPHMQEFQQQILLFLLCKLQGNQDVRYKPKAFSLRRTKFEY